MNIWRTFCTFLILGVGCGCGADRSPAERELLRKWSAPNISVEERVEAVNHCFTNGTPIASVITLLGTNYSRFTPVALYSADEPKTKQALDLIYDFGAESVVIKVTVDEHTSPFYGQFSEARFLANKTNSSNLQ